jgi:uncharacterized DUF497 family protein
MSLHFSWDPTKAVANARKHGVTFEEATTAFEDPMARIYLDTRHSQDEIREILVGYSVRMRLLLVAFTEREGIIRIISARKATFLERLDHEQAKTN